MPTLTRPSQIVGVPAAHNLLSVLKNDNTEQLVANDTTQRTIWTANIPAAEIAANDCLLAAAYVAVLNNSGGNQNYTFTWVFGGTSLAATITGVGTNTTTFSALVKLMIKNAGATNSQKAVMTVAGQGIVPATAYTTMAIDTTQAQLLFLKVTCGSNTATQNVIELLAQAIYGKQT